MPKGQRRGASAKNVQPPPTSVAEPGPQPSHSIGPDVAVSPPSSPSSSSSIDEDISNVSEMHGGGEGSYVMSASRPESPSMEGQETDDSVTCQWEDCGVVFTHLPTLINHIHNEHIGVHKSNYTCEWSTCARRGLAQTSRFALISHIRSHTGEKPFICPLPECDKSFTRSDALAKHMRLQHNIEPPAPGRGGSRKRKRGAGDDTPGTATPAAGSTSSSMPAHTSGFSTFKVEPNTPSELVLDDDSGLDYINPTRSKGSAATSASTTNGRAKRPPRPSPLQAQHTLPANDPQDDDIHLQGQGPGEDDDGYTSSASDVLPPSLQAHFDESTGLVMGRTPAKAMYLLMKAKRDYALKERENLLDQLRVMKMEVKKQTDEKDSALDALLKNLLGEQQAHVLMLNDDGSSTNPAPPPLNPHTAYSMVAGPSSVVGGNENYRQIRPPPSFSGMHNGAGSRSISTTSRGR